MFKTLREMAGYSTSYASEELGIKRTTLYKYEEYFSIPSFKILLKMQEVYKCKFEDVLSAYKIAKGAYQEKQRK